MNSRQAPGPLDERRRTFHLWHLALAVLVASLIFGAIRALAREPSGPVIGGVAAIVLASVVGVGLSFGLIRAGRALAGRATADLKVRGVRMGGVIGFGVWFVGIVVEVGFVLASIVIGPVAAIALALWITRLAGL